MGDAVRHMGFFDHLDELRKRLISCLIAVAVASLGCFFGVDPIFQWLIRPLKNVATHKLIVLSPLELIITQMKLALLAGVFIAMPWVLLQLWRFIAPGLYPHERRWLLPFVFLGTLFFVGGAAFGFYVVLPIGFQYLGETIPAGIETHYSVAVYFSLVIHMVLAFGVVFELPVIMWIFSAAGLVSPKKYAKFRKYWIVLATIIGGVLTPPDPITQILMAVPLILFFELGILGARFLYTRQESDAIEQVTIEERL